MHDMKKIIMMLSLAGVLSACIREKITENEVKLGDSLPEFEVTMNDGTVVSDTSLKGEVSIVMFFHISCPDCQQVLPSVQRIYDDYASENLKTALTLSLRKAALLIRLVQNSFVIWIPEK
jgi:cytochrome oxidase Cu insertion factor (SCO1/SenC/PrrC family)